MLVLGTFIGNLHWNLKHSYPFVDDNVLTPTATIRKAKCTAVVQKCCVYDGTDGSEDQEGGPDRNGKQNEIAVSNICYRFQEGNQVNN
jgi:hypothetical protein